MQQMLENGLESRADQRGVLMCLVDGTFSPSDVARIRRLSTYIKRAGRRPNVKPISDGKGMQIGSDNKIRR
jgi:hypothetical protein